MKKTLFTFLALIISLLSIGQVSVSGTVVESGSNNPIPMSIVSINGSEHLIVTDEKGYFSFELQKSGVYNLKVSKKGYKSYYDELKISSNVELLISLNTIENNKESKVNTTIVKPKNSIIKANKNQKKNNKLSLSGTILDIDSKEIVDQVLISIDGLKRKFTTNPLGEFYIVLPEKKDYNITIIHNDYETLNQTITVDKSLELTILMTKIFVTIMADEVEVSGTRATDVTPTTIKKISKKELNENNLGQDLPFLLETTPSVVATSDGGSGTGYTSMRIRGSDMTRINFTINGFPVNDPESHGVFLVNTPDLASSAEDIEIQRGVGTSTNGAGAFGASVNINTNKKNNKAYAEFNNSYGSLNTLKNTIKLGSGLLFKHFTIDGRFSHIKTDGYIDRSQAQMFGYALNAAYYNKNTVIRFNFFSGKEVTHQAWNGVSYSEMQTDRTFNNAGTDYYQKEVPYDNEIDNYRQDNYQLSASHQFGTSITANIGFHYTKGKGYFEQYKVGQDLLDYNVIGATESTDLIRRRWLDNNLFGSIFSVQYKRKKINAKLGGGWNQYGGDHFGEIIWADNAQGASIRDKYYFNDALKTDFNIFVKAEYKVIKRLLLFADIQYRSVAYSADGLDSDQTHIFEDVDYNFVNPKAGLTFLLGEKMNSQVYASFAMANKEPTRNDFIDASPGTEPKHETLYNLEAGYRYKSKKLNIGANYFYMHYKNQLVLTGALNDVGSPVRVNVDKSFRTGIELDFAYEPLEKFGIKGSGAWSINEIAAFSVIDYYGNTTNYDKTKISYSPTLVGNLEIYTKAFKGFKLAVINKYVSEQFLDNTSDKRKVLTPYFLMDARASYSFYPKFMREIELIFKANNILDTKYSSNGYVYYDTPYFYPQAGPTFMGAVNLKF